nr:prosaposin-like [Ipomoea batatas]
MGLAGGGEFLDYKNQVLNMVYPIVEVLQLLLKACDSAKNFSTKCKKLVFEYAPLILVNAEQFLEINDVCTLLHVCDSPTLGIELASPRMEESRGLEAFSILRKKTSGNLVHML